MKLLGVSASRISTYEQCLFKYFLVYHLKAKLKSNFGATNGSLIHSVLER
jgi:ATP-dependent helicase/DNAse subunit B